MRVYVAVMFLLYIEVKGGLSESVRLIEGDPKARVKDISKITPGVRYHLENCENGKVVFRSCPPEEEMKGCRNKTSHRFSVDDKSIFLHNVTESDAGCYVFQVAGNNSEPFNVTVETPHRSTETPHLTSTESPNTINITLAICLTIASIMLASIIALAVVLACCIYKHKEKIKIWFTRRKLEPHSDMSVQSPESEETSMDSVITIDNENHQQHQSLLLSD